MCYKLGKLIYVADEFSMRLKVLLELAMNSYYKLSLTLWIKCLQYAISGISNAINIKNFSEKIYFRMQLTNGSRSEAFILIAARSIIGSNRVTQAGSKMSKFCFKRIFYTSIDDEIYSLYLKTLFNWIA